MTTYPRPDILVGDALGSVVMVVEVEGRPLGDDFRKSEAWRQIVESKERSRAPYALLFSPGKSVLLGPEGEPIVFDGQTVLDLYGISKLPRFEPGGVAETAVYTWLVDLSLGIERPAPQDFPGIVGDEIRRAARSRS